MLYVPMMKMFFKWISKEITENENQDAVERLYHLALLSVNNSELYTSQTQFRLTENKGKRHTSNGSGSQ